MCNTFHPSLVLNKIYAYENLPENCTYIHRDYICKL